MRRMQDDVLLHVTGLTREEAAVGLFKGTIRLFGGEIRRSDLWISRQPGLWPFDMAVGTASDPTTWLTVGTAGVAKVGGLFSEAAEAVEASNAERSILSAPTFRQASGEFGIDLSAAGSAEREAAGLAGAAPAAQTVDPQLDSNILSALINPHDPLHGDAVAFVTSNRAAGLSANRSAYTEFLQRYSKYQFSVLRQRYGISLIRELPMEDLGAAASRLQRAFPDARVLSDADARVAASSFLKKERFATNDLRLFKRAKDLGLNVEYVGSGASAAAAARYIPNPVAIPAR